MKGPKWLLLFLAALLATFAVWGAFNLVTDPFGVFGDPVFGWDSYSQTLNPRTGKIAYLQNHKEDYDAYIVGSSSAASYLPDTLAQYTEERWYNLFHYGADIAYDKDLIAWLLQNDNDVRHIILVLGLSEANTLFEEEDLTDRAHYMVSGEHPLRFYTDFLFASPSYGVEKLSSMQKDTEMPQAFDVFLPHDGTYDKRLRDAESIGSLDAYLTKNGGDFQHSAEQGSLSRIDECAKTVGEIRVMCDAASVELTVILSPVYEGQLAGVTDESLNTYFTALAEVTDYCNFSISPLSYDPRYFYDTTHTRNAAADMVLAKIFGDTSAYTPASFGVFCENGEAESAEHMKETADRALLETESVNIPILLYHHLDPGAKENGTVLHPDTFDAHMALLLENGYTTVTFDDIIAYVEHGTPLPEKPVIVTFDDGYASNYEYAFPVLRKNGQKATVFVIGASVGHDRYYKNTSYPLTPHFGEAEIREMTASGVIAIESHTFDMHQWAPYETGDAIRETILSLEGESDADYITAMQKDTELQRRLFGSMDQGTPTVLAFPSGEWTDIANVVLTASGIRATVTTDAHRINTLVPGLPQSLLCLGRLNVSSDITAVDILRYCEMTAE